jgi:hypothetical protein
MSRVIGIAALVLAGGFAFTQAQAQSSAQSPAGSMPPAKTMPPSGAMPPPGGMPHGAMPNAPAMGVSPSSAERIVWSCQAGDLGNPAVMVNFVEKTALSTRSAGMAKATLEGDKVRWTETEPEGTLKYVLDRKTGELQVTRTPPKGKDVVYKGKCGAPDKSKKGTKHG